MELHVVFSYSTRAGLREAFGPDVTVARYSDDLSVGPINPVEAVKRRIWIDTNIGYDNPDITEDDQTFWPCVLNPEVSRIAWFSRRNVHEYCGFLEYLRRLNNLSTQIVDTTDVICSEDEFFRGTASIPAGRILSENLLATARPITAQFGSDCLMLWDGLRIENGDLRVLDCNGRPASVPISFYDQALLSVTTDDWRPMLRIVGDALAGMWANDLFLISRLYNLIDIGLLASREHNGQRHPDVKRVRP